MYGVLLLLPRILN